MACLSEFTTRDDVATTHLAAFLTQRDFIQVRSL